VLSTVYNIGISPGSIGLGATVNVLIMSVIGGLGHPAGAFIGSLIFTVFDTFAATIYDRDRFNTLIGLAFLLIVLVSPDGAIGIGARLGRVFGGAHRRGAQAVRGEVRTRAPRQGTAKEEMP
jgi:branched-chain amino acid transport system permease protein